MKRNIFTNHQTNEKNLKWKNCIKREKELYERHDDVRSPFTRDYNRILHCTAYRRLKHKTQVFFATTNDHICTRIEHVNHVTSVSYTIAKFLGLNTELTNAIAIGHDLGHPPFGHAGEEFLTKIAEKKLKKNFWHEGHSLRVIDKTETIENPNNYQENLSLTYAVRDGIVCHCGEVDENAIFPRNDFLALESLNRASEYSPYTWEGCIVKIADKISYLGRDIQDAITLKILTKEQLNKLKNDINHIITKINGRDQIKEINNTVLIHNFITDLCNHSSPDDGIRISEPSLELMNFLKKFNYKHIYKHERLNIYKQYAELIINSIYNTLEKLYDGQDTFEKLDKYKDTYPVLATYFLEWLIKLSHYEDRDMRYYKNEILYQLNKSEDYYSAIIDFISGMTDSFAIKVFQELTSFA